MATTRRASSWVRRTVGFGPIAAFAALVGCEQPPAPPPRAAPPPVADPAVAPAPVALDASTPFDASTALADATATSQDTIALPAEPWYRDKPDRYDDCTPPLAQMPARHFPDPFATCDPHEESYSTPPPGPELHFHYRRFSVALTTSRRATDAATCCYMIWEFPRHRER